MASVTLIPPAALEWLTGAERASILMVGAADGYAPVLAEAGHAVMVADPDSSALTALAGRRSGIHIVAARGESLPFDPDCFDLVLAIQNFHTFAPGLALSEWARVLRSQGRIGLAYLTRDDSVPWVKKLKRIIQTALPQAMTSDHGADSLTALIGSPHFPVVEQTSFRLWVPSTRDQLQNSARQAPGARSAPPDQLSAMVEEVGQLYDEYARVPDPLMLPYQIRCWRATVHRLGTRPSPAPTDEGLTISL